MKPSAAVAVERLPPQNIEAEEAVLGSLLIDPDAIVKVAPVLRPADFYREKHGWIYDAILTLHQNRAPVDFLTVCDELDRRGQLKEAGGPAYIASLINATPTSIHAVHYASIVERQAVRRQLIDAAKVVGQAAYAEKDDLDESIAAAQSAVLGVQRRGRNRAQTMKSLVSEHYDRIEHLSRNGRCVGIPTGFHDLDKVLGGMQDGDMIILAARPSVGKTSLALAIACNVANAGLPVAIFSLEMSHEQVINRIVAAWTRIDTVRLRNGDITDAEMVRYIGALNDLSGLPIVVDDTPAITPAYLQSKLIQLRAEHGIRLAVIDYLQLMHGSSKADRYELITEVSQAVKAIAMKEGLPILALSQLSRSVEARSDKRPILSDLRDSGDLEQSADVVMFIYRDEVYNENSARKNIADIIIAKSRNGPTGTASLYFERACTRFCNAELTVKEVSL